MIDRILRVAPLRRYLGVSPLGCQDGGGLNVPVGSEPHGIGEYRRVGNYISFNVVAHLPTEISLYRAIQKDVT